MKKIFDRGIPTESNVSIPFEQIIYYCVKDEISKEYKEKYGEDYCEHMREEIGGLIQNNLYDFNMYLHREYDSLIPPAFLTIGVNDNLSRHLTIYPSSIYYYMLTRLNKSKLIEEALPIDKLIEEINSSKKGLHFKYASNIDEYPLLSKEYKEIIEYQNGIIKELANYKEQKTLNEKLGKLKGNIFYKPSVSLNDIKKNMAIYLKKLKKYKLYDNVSVDDIILGKRKVTKMTPEEFCEFVKDKYDKALDDNKHKCIPQVIKDIYSFSIDETILDKYIDKDKFGLLLACYHLDSAYKLNANRTQNLSYVTKYLDDVADSLDSDLSIITNCDFLGLHEKNTSINIGLLKKYYTNFLINHPEVPIMNVSSDDFKGQNLDEVAIYVKEQESSINVDFDFLIADDNIFDIKESISGYKEAISSITDEEKRKTIEEKLRILEEKLAFFENDSYVEERKPIDLQFSIIRQKRVQAPGKNNLSFQIFGKNKFDGYIGYVYGSGIILLERYYKNAKKLTTDNYAIYVMNISQFLELCQKSKGEIIVNKLCERISHSSGWQERAAKIISTPPTEETLEQIQTFKKSLRNK